MGLDMYLNKKIYVFTQYQYKDNYKTTITIDTGENSLSFETKTGTDYDLADAYWRKANAVHNWFVQNVQNGEDDCGTYELTEEKLKELRDVCEKILSTRVSKGTAIAINQAKELLPTKGGFFYGNTDYDEYYFGELLDTINQIDDLIQTEPPEEIEGVSFSVYYEYSSSW